jgi:hypothetical protein
VDGVRWLVGDGNDAVRVMSRVRLATLGAAFASVDVCLRLIVYGWVRFALGYESHAAQVACVMKDASTIFFIMVAFALVLREDVRRMQLRPRFWPLPQIVFARPLANVLVAALFAVSFAYALFYLVNGELAFVAGWRGSSDDAGSTAGNGTQALRSADAACSTSVSALSLAALLVGLYLGPGAIAFAVFSSWVRGRAAADGVLG